MNTQTQQRKRLCRSRLAQVLSYFFIRRLFRSNVDSDLGNQRDRKRQEPVSLFPLCHAPEIIVTLAGGLD
jgi:hypothetical protein